MTVGIFASTDETLRTRTRAFVIYDKTSGEVLHVHRSISFPKSPPAREEPEVLVRRLARNSANADFVEIDENEVNQSQPVRVDVSARRLVAIKARAIGKSKKSSRRRSASVKAKRRKR